MLFGVGECHYANEIYLRPTPVTTVTKIGQFEYKITTIGLHMTAPTHDHKAANINVKT